MYYKVEVNKELLQEYIDISNTPKTQHGAMKPTKTITTWRPFGLKTWSPGILVLQNNK